MSRKVSRALQIARRVKRADGGEVSFDDRFTGEPYRETADDLAARARNSLRTQPQRLEGYVPDKTDEVGGPLISDGGEFSPGLPWANKAADIGSKVVRGFGEGIVHDLSVPGAGMKPNPYPEGSEEWHWYNDQLQQASTQWGPSMALNTMGTGMPFAKPGAAGIFGGRLAQTADHAALARAEKMHAEGATPEAIHKDTGWFQGPDGQWRYEIPDDKSAFYRPQTKYTIDNYDIVNPHHTDVGSAYVHPDLYAAYPDLKPMDLDFAQDPSKNGYYRRPSEPSPGDLIRPPPEQIGISTKPDRYGENKDAARSTMLHELQHAVQTREGFVPGSSPGAMQQVVEAGQDARLMQQRLAEGYSPEEISAGFQKAFGRPPHPAAKTLVEQLTPEQLAKIENDPYEAYRRIYGEVEARNVQKRRDMTPEERRAAPPWTTEDIPREKQLIGAPHDPAAPPLPAADAAAGPAPAADPGAMGPGGGGSRGNASLPEAQATAARWAGERQPLEGLPGALKIGDEHFVPGPIGKIHDVAEDYMRTHHPDRPYTPPTKYHPLDPEHSKAIAQAYEEMAHTPNDPATKASYDALIKETQDQYNAIKKTGLKIEPITPGMEDPYAANPRLAAKDVAENNHLWFFPTEGGFGTVNKITDNPMLRNTGEKIGDHELLANDMFRIVHDYFGHLKEGHGFRAAGEDNAWRTHAQMYSDIARPAMTTETRGQNSWVNYGPHGETNRKATAADTTYADQKVGLMPEWVMRDRNSPAPVMVYHGTPHSFDRFDISKIGEGEGNQAYGHGLYFAGHEPVSEWYRHQLAARQDPLLKKYKLQDVGHVIGSHLSDFGGDAAKLAAKYADERNKLITGGDDSKATANMIDEYDRRIKYLENPKRSKGHMYQVAMDVDPQHLLDYDLPFNDQSQHVQGRTGPDMEASVKQQLEAIDRILAKGGEGREGSRFYRPLSSFKRKDLEGRKMLLEQTGPASLTGKDIYTRMGLPAISQNEGYVKAAKRLKELEVPGLRYKDAGSRAPGQKGSHNYVMFGDDKLKIHRKYRKGGGVKALQLARRIKRADGGAAFGVLSPAEEAERPEPIAAKVIRGAAESMATLPKRAYESSQRMVETGEYDPAPIMEAAMLPMGTGAIAGVKALPSEAMLGSGLIRRKAPKVDAPAVLEGRSRFVDPDTGLPIKSPAYTKEAQAISREIAQTPKGEGPLDMSLQGQIPGVEQRPLERYVPARGISPRLRDAMENPEVAQGLEESMRKGAGVRDWYHTEPVRQAFVETLGPEAGEAAFGRYMDYVAATSPRSDVPTNIRNASYYYGGGSHDAALPYPYGHVAQNLHKQNVGNLLDNGGWDIFQNPKPASFAQNLRGNLEPVTVDTHAFRNIGMRTGDPRFLETSISNEYKGTDPGEASLAGRYGEIRAKTNKAGKEKNIVTYRPQQLHKEGRLTMEEAKDIPSFWASKPNENEYAAAEGLFRDVGQRVGMRPADAQAAAWSGAGDLTGLGTVGTHTFPELMNERIMFTAKMRGQDPRQVLQDFVRGRKPLLASGGAVSKVDDALELARSIKRARGGKVHVGAIMGDTDGRADEVPMEVPDGAYVLTADHVSSMGEGNTLSGFKKLDKMFPKSAAAHAVRKTVKRANGGAVPIYAADGEYVIHPEDITDRWGDLEAGHRYLDAWQTSSRKEHVNTLRNLAPPAQD